MPRIDHLTAQGSLPAPPALGTEGYFGAGSSGSDLPTVVPYYWFNWIQETLRSTFTTAGVSDASWSVFSNLTTAINALIATATASLANGTSLGKDAIKGQAPVWASGTSINFPSITECWDSARSTYLTIPAGTLNLASVGLNGLDSGSIAANTWYYVYAVAGGFVASTNATAPAGYSVYRQLPYFIKTLSNAATLQPFTMHASIGMVQCWWASEYPDKTLHTSPSGTPSQISLASTVPPIATPSNCRLLYESRSTTAVNATNGAWNMHWSPTNTANDTQIIVYNENHTTGFTTVKHSLPISSTRTAYIWYTGTPNGGAWNGLGLGYEYHY